MRICVNVMRDWPSERFEIAHDPVIYDRKYL